MSYTFKVYIGGVGGMEDADDYTSKVIRASYKKNFCADSSFDVMLDGMTKVGESNVAKHKNVFFMIYDDSNYWLLYKGEIESITWSGKYRCQINGKQCMRGSSGNSGSLRGEKVSQGTQQGDLDINALCNTSTWHEDGEGIKDGKTNGEGTGKRDW